MKSFNKIKKNGKGEKFKKNKNYSKNLKIISYRVFTRGSEGFIFKASYDFPFSFLFPIAPLSLLSFFFSFNRFLTYLKQNNLK